MNTALEYFEKDCFINTFDLKSGYHHIDVHADSHTYLGFQWEGVYYVFTVLPFGSSMFLIMPQTLSQALEELWA